MMRPAIIRTIFLKGVPHYTDGELTLPVIAGAQIDWERYERASGQNDSRARPIINPHAESMIGQIVYDYDTGEGWEIYRKGATRDRSGNLVRASYGLIQRNPNGRGGRTRKPVGTTWFMPTGEIALMGEDGNISSQRTLREGERGAGGMGSAADTRDYAGEAAADDARQSARDEAQRAWEAQQAAEQRAYEAQQEAEQRAYQAEQERMQREWEAQQAEIERQNRLRLQRLGDLTNLVGQFAGIQARARETLAGLQGDPFKFAAAKQGLAPQGTTPMESFSGQLNQFAGQPMPTIDPNAPLSAIEQQIMGLQGQMAPQAPKIFGMAGGGQVSGGPQTVLVGEQGPEIVMGSDFKVVPLTASAASGYDTDSLLPALAPLYAGLGMGSVPKANALYAHNYGTPVGFNTGGNIGALGFNPRLVRDQQSGATYYRNNADQWEHIQSPDDFTKFGFNWKDVYNVDNVTGHMGGAMTAKPTVPVGMPDAFGPLSSPIIEPVTGAILPAPYRAAAFLNQMRLQNPQLYQLALSAYANSMTRPNDPNSRLGYTQAGVEAEVRQALPFGQEHGLIGLR